MSLAGQESKISVLGKNFFANEKANVQYEEAFRKAGLDLFQVDSDDTQSLIQQSPIREELIASLDQWARAISNLSPDQNSESRSASNLLNRLNIVSTTADRVDRNEWRKRVRHSLLHIARIALAAPVNDQSERHVTLLKELALSDEAGKQAPELVAWFGSILRDVGEQDAAITMLRNVQQDNPSSFWINFELGSSLLRNGDSNQAIEYMRAALAVRPDSLELLTIMITALEESGRLDESHQFRKVMNSANSSGATGPVGSL